MLSLLFRYRQSQLRSLSSGLDAHGGGVEEAVRGGGWDGWREEGGALSPEGTQVRAGRCRGREKVPTEGKGNGHMGINGKTHRQRSSPVAGSGAATIAFVQKWVCLVVSLAAVYFCVIYHTHTHRRLFVC